MKDAIKERLKKPQTVVSVAAAVLFIAAFAFSYVKWGGRMLDLVSDTQGFKDWLQSFGVWGRVIFVGIRSLQTVVKIIPAEPLEIGTGFVYGTLGGCLLCFAGTFLGSLVIILLTRLFGKRVISLFVPEEKIRELGFLNDEKKISGLLLCIYLIPGTPKDFITYLTCILPISTTRFMVYNNACKNTVHYHLYMVRGGAWRKQLQGIRADFRCDADFKPFGRCRLSEGDSCPRRLRKSQTDSRKQSKIQITVFFYSR